MCQRAYDNSKSLKCYGGRKVWGRGGDSYGTSCIRQDMSFTRTKSWQEILDLFPCLYNEESCPFVR